MINKTEISTSDDLEIRKQYVYRPFKSRTASDDIITIGKKSGASRHFPAAIKEWKNSCYAYNKGSLKHLPAIDDTVASLIKSYFHLSNSKVAPRSKRMRSLRRKYTAKRLFASKPEVKQTNDKVIVTVYTFNREKQFLLKKLYFYNRRSEFVNMWRDKNRLSSIRLYKDLADYYPRTIKNTISLNKRIQLAAKQIIRNNPSLYPEFVSAASSQKNKVNAYIKLCRQIQHSIVNKKHEKNYLIEGKLIDNKKHPFYYIATESKINRYSRKLNRFFKKKGESIKKAIYVRRKMKNFVSEQSRPSRKEKSKMGKRIIPYSGIKLKNEMNFLSFKLLLKNKKYAYARKLFYYYFLKYALSIFNVKVFAFKGPYEPSEKIINSIIDSNVLLNVEKIIKIKRKGKRNKKSKFIYNMDKTMAPLYKTPSSLTGKGTKVKIYFYTIKTKTNLIKKMVKAKTNENVDSFLKKTKPTIVTLNLLKNGTKLDSLDYVLSNVNFVVSQFLDKMLVNSRILEKDRKLSIIFQKFCKNYYSRFLSKLWKKEALFSTNYTKLMVNKFKFNRFLPNLKLLISKIYNKKTELNIINLKYSYLNTDIYTDTIALKLRKKLSLLKVIRRAIHLAKRPQSYIDRTNMNVDYDLNKLASLRKYGSLNFKNLNDNNRIYNLSLQNVLERLYPRSLVTKAEQITNRDYKQANVHVVPGKIKNILNIIKYKTLSGVRIEGAGRLTRRYTASRAVFKFRYKGSLRNIDYSRKIEFRKRSMPTVMLRNQVKANSQYSVISTKRRIGAFGIKGWISGY